MRVKEGRAHCVKKNFYQLVVRKLTLMDLIFGMMHANKQHVFYKCKLNSVPYLVT